jgi:hypothetical protein
MFRGALYALLLPPRGLESVTLCHHHASLRASPLQRHTCGTTAQVSSFHIDDNLSCQHGLPGQLPYHAKEGVITGTVVGAQNRAHGCHTKRPPPSMCSTSPVI